MRPQTGRRRLCANVPKRMSLDHDGLAEQAVHGMTTNERLAAAGLLESFDAAAKMQDRDRMIELLRRTDLADEAVAIAETILANPKRYGF